MNTLNTPNSFSTLKRKSEEKQTAQGAFSGWWWEVFFPLPFLPPYLFPMLKQRVDIKKVTV